MTSRRGVFRLCVEYILRPALGLWRVKPAVQVYFYFSTCTDYLEYDPKDVIKNPIVVHFSFTFLFDVEMSGEAPNIDVVTIMWWLLLVEELAEGQRLLLLEMTEDEGRLIGSKSPVAR